jgi:hypothetical protein
VKTGAPDFAKQNITDVGLRMSVCAGLVMVDQSGNIIRLAHYTAQEHFERQWIYWFLVAQTDIAATFITYLSFNTFASGICKTDGGLEERLLQYPLYDFSTRFWAYHVCASGAELKQLIFRFLENGANVSAACQAMPVSESSGHPNYSQKVPNSRFRAVPCCSFRACQDYQIATRHRISRRC